MSIYCTYITTYSGNKLPPFYIGYSKVCKVKNGYNGSVTSKIYKEIWNYERKNNLYLFKTKILKTFYDIKEAQAHELKLLRYFKVKMNPMYINRSIGGHANNTGYINITDGLTLKKIPKDNLIPENWYQGLPKYMIEKIGKNRKPKNIITPEGLALIREKRCGDKSSSKRPEVRKKISDTLMGKTWEDLYGIDKSLEFKNNYSKNFTGKGNPFFGKSHTQESIEKNRKAHIGLVVAKDINGNFIKVTKEEFDRRDDLRGNSIGQICITNGTVDRKIEKGGDIPNGWYKGSFKKDKYNTIHNKIISKKILKTEKIPDGWILGRITKRSKNHER